MRKLAVAMLLLASPAMADGTGSGAQEGIAPPVVSCKPIGKTAKGEFVYHVDCKKPEVPKKK